MWIRYVRLVCGTKLRFQSEWDDTLRNVDEDFEVERSVRKVGYLVASAFLRVIERMKQPQPEDEGNASTALP
jgi:hypothetical protein